MASAADRKAMQLVKADLDRFQNAQRYYEAIIGQYQYVHPQLNVFHDPTKGRGIKAMKDIPAGTILISNPSGLRADLDERQDQRRGNIQLGQLLFQQVTKYGFDLERLSVPNDTLGLFDDFQQPDFATDDTLSRGQFAQKEYPLREVAPILPEFLCPNLQSLPQYPNPFIYADLEGKPQHIQLSVPTDLPELLRANLINAMRDQKGGYQLLMRCALIAQENSVMCPYNMPFLLPHMFIKPKPSDPKEVAAKLKEQQAKEKDVNKKPVQKKSTPKVLTGRKGTTLTLPTKPQPEKAVVEKKEPVKAKEDEPEEKKTLPLQYNFFEQVAKDYNTGDDIPATLIRQCNQLIHNEDDEDEDDEDEDVEEEETAKTKIQNKVTKGNQKQQQQQQQDEYDELLMESRDSLALFPTFSLLNHNCAPNSTPLFFHIPSNDTLSQLYREHKESVQDDLDPVYSLPRAASVGSCVVVVALQDIKAGEELTINYTPLAHCETSPHLTRDRAPVIRYIPWLQEFRQAQNIRVHNMACKCNICQCDVLLQKAIGTKTTIGEEHDIIQEGLKQGKTLQEQIEAKKSTFDAAIEEQKELTPLIELPNEIKDDINTVDPKILATRLLLHSVVLTEKKSTYNRNVLPLFLYHNRHTGEPHDYSYANPDELLQQLHEFVEHPLWKAIFASRGGYDKVNSTTQFLTVPEIFNTSQELIKDVAIAIELGRKDNTTCKPIADIDTQESLQDKNSIPIIIPSGFNVANVADKDAKIPYAIASSSQSTVIPTIASLDVTSSFAAAIGIYATISSSFERIQQHGIELDMPSTDVETKKDTTDVVEPEVPAISTNAPETDLLYDGTVVPAGTAAKELERQKNIKTNALVNVSDGTVITPDEEIRKYFKELATYREMVGILESILCEVLGLNDSEGRKEYLVPTHWFIPTVLGVLHPLYLKLGGRTEATIASLYLALITGLSVPLSNVVPPPTTQIPYRTPREMREANIINDYWTFQQIVAPIPGVPLRPLHPTLISLFSYLYEALEDLLRDCEMALQFSKEKIAILSAEAEQTDEIKSQIEHYSKEYEFAMNLNQAVYFLGQSIDDYLL